MHAKLLTVLSLMLAPTLAAPLTFSTDVAPTADTAPAATSPTYSTPPPPPPVLVLYWRRRALGKLFLKRGAPLPLGKAESSVIREEVLPEPYRIIRPGDVVTMEFEPSRLNLELDEDGVVTNVRYG